MRCMDKPGGAEDGCEPEEGERDGAELEADADGGAAGGL